MQEAQESQLLRLRKMFQLAWDGKGFHLNLKQLNDSELDQILKWRDERVKEENEKLASM